MQKKILKPAILSEEKEPARVAFPIVGVGASAGGLAAFTELLTHLPADTGMAFILVQHLDPEHESSLALLLGRATSMPVLVATERMRVAPNHIYVIPHDRMLAFAKGMLTLQVRGAARTLPHSIDFLFESLAGDQREKAIGVILSGAAADGTLGLEAIKAEGGITFAQDVTAKYDSMPRSAIAAGCVDFVLSPTAIAAELARIAKHPYLRGQEVGKARAVIPVPRNARLGEVPADQEGKPSGFARILALLQTRFNVDFSLYKPATIHRRITRRMVLNRCETIEAYAASLRSVEKELEALFADLLIGVTSFLRNKDAFVALREKAGKTILAPGRTDPVRVWVPGCSSGQEAYSIAMMLTEYAEKSGVTVPVLQIFGTDLNEATLSKARHGLYARSQVADLSAERLRRFFVEEEGGYRVCKMLRDACVFAHHNLMGDPPFSKMDLISCRNLLIYLEADLQKKILPAFHYALKPDGILFLGASESIGSFTDLFESIDKKHKIYRGKISPRRTMPQRFPPRHPSAKRTSNVNTAGAAVLSEGLNAQREADRVAMLQYAPPGVLIDTRWKVIQFRGATGPYLQPPPGKADFDLLKMAREGLMLPLRATINAARKHQRPVRRKNVPMSDGGKARLLTISVTPLKNLRELCFLVLFEEPGLQVYRAGEVDELPGPRSALAGSAAAGKVPARLREQQRRIANLEAELSETRDYVQSLQEQHETAHDGITASSEEVQSANEEFQSVNEELETSKEELESTNEELITVNDEMVHRNTELSRLNSDLTNLYVSINTAILVVGRDLTLWRFTTPAEKLFNLLPSDLGRPISGIRHNLAFPDLEKLITEVMDCGVVREREIQERTGRWYQLRIRPYLTLDDKVTGAVLTLVDIDALKQGEQQIKAARDFAEATIRTARDPLVVLRADLRVKSASEAFYRMFQTTPGRTEGRSIFELGARQWQLPALRQLLDRVLPDDSSFNDYEVAGIFPDIGQRTMLVSARRLQTEEASDLILLSIEDMTERLESRAAIKRSEIRYRRLFEAAKDGIIMIDPATRKITAANPFIVEFLGYSQTELKGRELWQIGLLKDEAASQEAFRELQGAGFIRYENLPLETKQGDQREVEFVSNLYDEDGHQVIQCNIRDITERKRTTLALRESEKRFRVLFELGPIGVYSCDASGVIMEYNARAAELWGRKPAPGNTGERFCGSAKMFAIAGHVLPHAQCPMAEILTGKISGRFEQELQIERPDGSRISVIAHIAALTNDQGIITGAINCFYDVTARRVAEDSLRDSEERLRLALANADMGSWRADLRSGLGTRDGNLNRILGFATVESTQPSEGRFATIYPEDKPPAFAAWQSAIETRGIYAAEFRVLRPDHTTRWLSEQGRFIAGENGRPDYVTGVTMDITERKLAEGVLHVAIDDLKQAQSAAERGSRAKDDFLAALSHELRTPLTPVLMASAALREDERLPLDAREQLGMIERNVELEARLIDDLLDLTKISHGKLQLRLEMFDGHHLIRRAMEIVRPEADAKGIVIDLSLMAPRSRLMADSARFQQVIWNLLRNAVKFTPENGRISVRTREAGIVKGESWLRIEVTDSGIGIETERLEQIFEPFDQGGLTGNHRFGGVGLGLAIARAVVDAHGGRIKAESEGVNRGATFVVELHGAADLQPGARELVPLHVGALAPVVSFTTSAAISVMPLGILLVDDHDSTLQALSRLLRQDGHWVVTAKTIADGLVAATTGKFDLVISDLGLPDGSGLQLMEKLRATYNLRGIALSGYGMEEDIRKSQSAGFVVHLVKPVSATELRRVIATLSPG